MRCPACMSESVSCYWYSARRARIVCPCGWISHAIDPRTPAHHQQARALPVADRLPRVDAATLIRGGWRERSDDWIAARLGVTATTVRRWRSGEVYPRPKRVEALRRMARRKDGGPSIAALLAAIEVAP